MLQNTQINIILYILQLQCWSFQEKHLHEKRNESILFIYFRIKIENIKKWSYEQVIDQNVSQIGIPRRNHEESNESTLMEFFGPIRSIIWTFLFWKWAMMDLTDCLRLLPVEEVDPHDGTSQCHTGSRASWASTSRTGWKCK